MAEPYPIMLSLAGRSAVVVGGGAVGRRKVAGLQAAGARVKVVDPSPARWGEGVEHVAEPYRAEHLAAAVVVIACTDDRAVNARVAADARAAGILVNVADDPEHCDFTLPAIHRAGGVTLAVGTAAGSASLAAAVRDLAAAALPEELPAFAEAIAALRQRVKAAIADPNRRRDLLIRLTGPAGLAAFRQGGREALEAMIAQADTVDGRDGS